MAHFVIMGCGRVGALLAHSLEDGGHSVAVIDKDPNAFRRLPAGFNGQRVTGVGFDLEVLKEARVAEAYAFAAVSSGDNSNMLATRVAREEFNVPHVVARIYDPGRAEVFQRLGIPTVASVRWSADQVLRRILPAHTLYGDYRDSTGTVMLRELNVAPAWRGQPLARIEELTGVRIAYITRFGESIIPNTGMLFQETDTLHAMMRVDAADDVDRILSETPQRAEKLAEELTEDVTDEVEQ